MRRVALALSLGCAVTLTAEQHDAVALTEVLARAGQQVERYFARAQSLVCVEIVRWLPLNSSFSSDGPGRTIESELRLSWTPEADGTPSTEAQMLRQLLRVNGRQPRANDPNNCTDAEQQFEEPQALSMLLPTQRDKYEFKLAGLARLDNRPALMIEFRLRARASVEAWLVEGRDDCLSFEVDGGKRGRLWIDAESYNVMRLDEGLVGMVEIPLPKKTARPSGGPTYWTLERLDTSIRFKPVTFTNPDETLILPVTMSSMRVTRGSGTPRLRMMTDYTKYQRFMTGGRVLGQ